ncbi:MAG: T9SS type A sorting domain-containing protein [Bacteroides sp.]|nr:T9SS type A sorting domain-containing protein [Roseburia sp.]MCM1347619.1 T9SS type A sorting domain-containing protein [Bacteroides sp.]MCM1420386.1 T9SS type A sorting domain-containing protein [Bacteroides sp.]
MKNISNVLKLAAIAVSFFGQVMPMAAQTGVSLNGYLRFMPKQFSYTGKPQVITQTGDYENSRICVYDENFELKKEFAQSYPSKKRVVKEERVIKGYVEEEDYTDYFYVENYEDVTEALNYVIEYAKSHGATEHTIDGTVHTFRPSELPDDPDSRYQYYTYTEGAYRGYEHRVHKVPEYSEDWQVVSDEIKEYGSYDVTLSLYDMDNNAFPDASFVATQTLFNNDEKYECLAFAYQPGTEGHTYESDYVYSGGKSIATKRETEYSERVLLVVSEDGTLLYSFPQCNIDYVDIYILNGKTYLAVYSSWDRGDDTIMFYEIEKETNSVKQVNLGGVTISPRMAHRSDNITVETGADNVSLRKDIVITSMSGQMMERHSIPAGETTAQIRATRLSSGVYNFTVYANGKKIDNGKIIIR